MENKKIYQTLQDRGDRLKVENDGPFSCNWENTWLGEGYYFWDTFLDNAHWWGRVRYKGKNYIICEAEIDFCNSKCFDLVGCTQHMDSFAKSIALMKKKGLYNENTTVARVFEFLKKAGIFTYEGIRVSGINSKNKKENKQNCLHFELRKPQYLDFMPAIQFCLFKIPSMNFRNFKIIYPEGYGYTDGYVV